MKKINMRYHSFPLHYSLLLLPPDRSTEYTTVTAIKSGSQSGSGNIAI